MNPAQRKKLKNSDSDYKAQDQGSASDNSSWRKYKKASFNFKMTKKQLKQNSIRSLLPIGICLSFQEKITSEQYLQLVNINDAEQISLNFKCMLAKVIDVIDGQHFKVLLFNNQKISKITLRLNGISTPDIKKAETKQFGLLIVKILKSMMQGKVVRVQTGEYDKLGCIFCRIYAITASPLSPYECESFFIKNNSQFCINDYLIEHDMAKGFQNKGKGQFGKKNYEQFRQKYETKQWPIIENYPLQMVKAHSIQGDYIQVQNQNDQ